MQYRDAGRVFLGEKETEGRGEAGGRGGGVRGVAVLMLKRPFVLTAVDRCVQSSVDSAVAASAPASSIPAPSTLFPPLSLSPTLLVASSAEVFPPAHLPFNRQESFYITPQCVFPVDRGCAQHPLEYIEVRVCACESMCVSRYECGCVHVRA